MLYGHLIFPSWFRIISFSYQLNLTHKKSHTGITAKTYLPSPFQPYVKTGNI